MVKQSDKPEEGTTYYFAPGGTSFKSPKIDADGIYKILDNKVVEEGITKQQRILFQNDVNVSVMNLKTKEIDPDLSSNLDDMVKEDDIALNFALQRAWRDTAEWGPSLYNPVWDYVDNEFRMLKLKRLPPESFANMGSTVTNVYNKILPGIMWDPKAAIKLDEFEKPMYNEDGTPIYIGKPAYWQTDDNGYITKLRNVEVLTDPIKGSFGGSPAIVPIFPYVKMLTYSWMRQMQKVNIYGSGGIWFLKVDDPTGDDKKFAQNIVKNVSSTNRYQLRPNMTIENLGISESGSALETISQLGMEIRQFFTPAGLIQKDGGTLIGGSSGPEFELYMSFIAGTHRWLEAYVRKLLRPWLVYNKYYEKGYRIIVDIPAPTVDKSELYLKVHDSGSKEGSLLPNEKRALLRSALPQQAGVDISDLDPAGLVELDAYNARVKPPTFNSQLQKIDALSKAIGANPLDPTYLIGSKEKARKLVQATLGIEEGE